MRRAVLLTVLLAWAVGAPAQAAVPAGNLLANPGAEAAAGGADSDTIDPPPSWTTTGAFTATQYGPDGPQAFPTTAQSASYGGGANFFAGGNQPTSTATQVVDVSGAAAEIDAASVTAAFSGLLGGYQNQADTMTIVATYLDGGGATLGSLQLGPVTADQRSNTTELLPQSASGTVPAGTRSIRVVMTANRLSGTSNDGYADNLSLTLTGPGGGGGTQPGQHGSATSLACNRGPDPTSPWTCYATVADTDAGAPSAPGGSVTFASSRGGSFDGPSCALTANPSRPTTATCTTTYTLGATGTDLTATYGGDSVHGTSTDAFTIKGLGDVLFCGASPLPACPPGTAPPQVCVTLWVGDCDGKLPPPDPLQICISAIENCNGFGGSKTAKPGTIDLSGLPASVTTTVGCGGKKSAARQLPGTPPLPGLCPVSMGVVEYSYITDAHEYNAAAQTWKSLVDQQRHATGMFSGFLGGDIQPAIDTIFRLAHFQDATFAQKLRAQIDTATDSLYECMKPAGQPADSCELAMSEYPVCSNPFNNPFTPGALGGSKADEETCADVVRAWSTAVQAAIAQMAKTKKNLGVDKPFKATLRARGSSARRRTFTILMAGQVTLKRGKSGKLKLTYGKGVKARLRARRKAGTRQLTAQVVVARGRIVGLAPLQATKSVHVVLARKHKHG